MPEPFVLPELARSLHMLGTSDDAASQAAHAAIFTPLLEARLRAATSNVDVMVAAFRGEALASHITARVIDAARSGIDDPPRARARSARARDLLDPLCAELRVLDVLVLGVAAGELAPWVEQLRRVFGAADESCRALARLLREPDDAPPRRRRRWFGSGRR